MSDSENDEHPPNDILLSDKKKVQFEPSSSSYVPSQSTMNSPHDYDGEDDVQDSKTEPLLAEDKENQASTEVTTKRKTVDLPAAVAFLFCFTFMIILSISFHFSNKPRLEPVEGTVKDYLFKTISHSILPIMIVALLSAFIGFVWSYFLRNVVKTTVWATAYSIPTLLLVCAIWCLSSAINEPRTRISAIITFFIFVGLFVMSTIFVKTYMKDKIVITIKLMELACEVLRDHPAIFGISGVVTIFYIGTATLCLWSFSRNFMLGFVKEVDGSSPIWVFNPESYLLMSFSGFVFLWTSAVISNLQTYILSGITCIWYFHRNDFLKLRHGVVHRAVIQSLTTSFGSVCLSALVVPTSNLSQIIAGIIAKRKFEKYPNFQRFITYSTDLVFRLTSIVNKYSIVYCSLKGTSFFESTKSITSILKRNSFERVTIDLFARFTLWLWCCCVSCLFALLINSYGIKNLDSVYGWATASMGFTVCYFVLSFFSEIILKVVDALFVCYFVEVDTYPDNPPSQDNIHVHNLFKRVIEPNDQVVFDENENEGNI